MIDLWHYTCSDHGVEGIRADRYLRPGRYPLCPDPLVWLTDLDVPMRAALGLTAVLLRCDRTAYRVRVAGGCAVPWTQYRRRLDAVDRELLEQSPGAMPRHWWVSTQRVPILADPEETRRTTRLVRGGRP